MTGKGPLKLFLLSSVVKFPDLMLKIDVPAKLGTHKGFVPIGIKVMNQWLPQITSSFNCKQHFLPVIYFPVQLLIKLTP